MKYLQIVLLCVTVVLAAQPHQHAHRRLARIGSPVEARDAAAVTETIRPVVTVYELNGVDIPYKEVEQGLEDGKYILLNNTTSTVISSTTSSTRSSIPTPTHSSTIKAKIVVKSSTTTSTTPTHAPATSDAPKPATSSASSSSSSAGLNAKFPSGTIKCSDFPSEYGPVYIDWLGLSGWSGVQNAAGFVLDITSKTPIVSLANAVSGDECTPYSFCSYACPAGYQKSQWPQSQGSTGQSVGGLWCNAEGYLELSRPDVPQLCTAGAGGVNVVNKLKKNVPWCRTDYPGTEGETIPLNTEPGNSYPLTNPISADYYSWEGASTTAQYYVNPQGVSVGDACCWSHPGSNMGNWAPVNVGVGVGAGSITYISLFPNIPTNPTGTLDYNIEITGDVTMKCEYTGGKFYSNGVEAPTGCTVTVSSGGNAYFEMS